MATSNNPVITGPLALIKVNGIVIGKMRGIRVNENFQRGNVQGLGSLIPDEKPALMWNGSLSCDFYNIDFSISQIPQAILRQVQTYQEWEDSVVLQLLGVTVDIYRKIPAPGAPTSGLIPSAEKPYAQISGLFLEGEGFDIAEAQVSGRNQSFTYLNPIIYPI